MSTALLTITTTTIIFCRRRVFSVAVVIVQLPQAPDDDELTLCVEGGRVSHSWCYLLSLWWVGAQMEVVVGGHAGQSQEVFVACQRMPEHFLSA